MPRSSKFSSIRKRARRQARKSSVVKDAVLGSINTGPRGFSIAKVKRVQHSFSQQVTIPRGSVGAKDTRPGYGYFEVPLNNLHHCGGNVGIQSTYFDYETVSPSFAESGYMYAEPIGFDMMQRLYKRYRVVNATVKVQRVPILKEADAAYKSAAYVFGTLSPVGGDTFGTTAGTITAPAHRTGNPLGRTGFTDAQALASSHEDLGTTHKANKLHQRLHMPFLEKRLVEKWTIVRGGSSQLDHMAMVWSADISKICSMGDKESLTGHTWRDTVGNPAQAALFTLYEVPVNQTITDLTKTWDTELGWTGDGSNTAFNSGSAPANGTTPALNGRDDKLAYGQNPGYTYNITIDYDVVYSDPRVTAHEVTGNPTANNLEPALSLQGPQQ